MTGTGESTLEMASIIIYMSDATALEARFCEFHLVIYPSNSLNQIEIWGRLPNRRHRLRAVCAMPQGMSIENYPLFYAYAVEFTGEAVEKVLQEIRLRSNNIQAIMQALSPLTGYVRQNCQIVRK